MVVSAAVGIGAGLAAVGFRLLIDASAWMFFGAGARNLALDAPSPLRLLVALLVAGSIVSLAVRQFGDAAVGTGIPHIISALRRRAPGLPWSFGPVKAVTAALTIGSGGSAGREGPIVAISGWLGLSVARWLRWPPKARRLLLAAGAAGGIAATFNAPVAGTFFALEILLGSFAMEAFGPVVVCCVFATLVSRAVFGDEPAFAIPTVHLGPAPEILVFFLLGAAAGLVGVVFTRSRRPMDRLVRRLPVPEWLLPLAVLPMVVIFPILGLSGVLGNGYDLIQALYTDGLPLGLVLLLIPAKIAATSLVLAGRGSGGVFAPGLVIGACLGAVFYGAFAQPLAHTSTGLGTYALVGAGALVGAVTHGPITASLILFEMTGSLRLIVPLLASVSVASLVARALDRESMYSLYLSEAEAPADPLDQLRVQDAASAVQPEMVVRPDASMLVAMERFAAVPLDHLWVVDEEGSYRGAVSTQSASKFVAAAAEQGSVLPVESCMETHLPRLAPDQSLHRALEQFLLGHAAELPVVADGRLEGFVEERTLLAILDRELLGDDNQLVKFVHPVEERGRVDFVEMPEGVRVAELVVPESLHDTPLSSLGLPDRYGAIVLLRKRALAGGDIARDLVQGSTRLHAGERLVLLASTGALQRLEQDLAATGGQGPPPVTGDVAEP
jgi:CIC family chloride channel protein